MATQLRELDNQQNLADYLRQVEAAPLGIVVQADGSETDLFFRDATNKIMHAGRFDWDCADPMRQK
jgi:hypothetical protein